jgi:hypothetical protein
VGGAKLAEGDGAKLAEGTSALGASPMVDNTTLACWVSPAEVVEHVRVSIGLRYYGNKFR